MPTSTPPRPTCSPACCSLPRAHRPRSPPCARGGATRGPGGRLQVRFVAVLDEPANICRIRDLDSLYSHYGSRGIVLVTILQNWAQGEAAWGAHGMEKLWSAANIRLYGGGVDDDR